MRPIPELFSPGRTALSIEIFPPKTPEGLKTLKERLDSFKAYKPDFVSVTYGAGGGNRDNHLALCTHIQEKLKVPALAHLTCAGHTTEQLHAITDALHGAGITNIMALRGDPPKGERDFKPTAGGPAYASELIRELGRKKGLSLGCAAYPEGHVEAPTEDVDLDHLKRKIDLGARYIVTQFFLDNVYFLRFRERLRRKGIQVPVVAGILPISNYSQVTKFSIVCGCTIPARVMRGLNGKSDADQEKFGLEHAAHQVEELLHHGVDGIHLYALNRRETVEHLAPLVRR